MISSISRAFSIARKQNRPALLTYTVAGDNSKNCLLYTSDAADD